MANIKNGLQNANEYLGMNLQELNNQKLSLETMIRSCLSEIEKKKKEISISRKNIKLLENNLKKVEEAMSFAQNNDIPLIKIVYIEKIVKDEFIGNNPNKSYYDARDWKSVTYYKYTLLEVNKLDYNKSRTLLFDSGLYKDKKEFSSALITHLQAVNASLIILSPEARIGIKSLQKYCKVYRQNDNRFDFNITKLVLLE